MKTITNFIENVVAPPLTKFAQMKYVKIIQKTFISLTALLIVGSLFLLFAQLPIPAYKEFIGEFATTLGMASGVGTGIISVLVVVASSMATVEYYNHHRHEKNDFFGPVVLAVASFFLINPAIFGFQMVDGAEVAFKGIPTTALGAVGIFTALIVSISTVELYRILLRKGFTLKMPDGVPPMVTQAFAALIPGTIIIFMWWFIRFVLGIDISTLIMGMFEPLLSIGDSPISVIIATVMNRLLWSVGINGGTVVNAVGRPIWETMNIANQELFNASQALQYTYSGIFIDNYIWTGLAPLALLLITRKSKRLKAMGWLALPAALFNIGEPLMFGLPIVLNPLLIIPFILGYLGLAISSIIGVTFFSLPVPALSIPWITPAPIRTLLATNGSWYAMIWVLVGWAFIALVFYPFVRIIDKQDAEGTTEQEDLIEGVE